MNQDKKILFMGTPDIAVEMLKALLEEGYNVIGVVSQPDKKAGRKKQLKPPEVKQYALTQNLKIYQPISIKDEYEMFMQMDIDLIVTCAYGQFIPTKLLAYPTYGSINIHASLLPKYRGGAPIHKAIINGEKQTGMSIMRMVKKMDAGDVMAQSIVDILENDTTGDLYDRLAISGAQLLKASLPKIFDQSAIFIPQNENEATFAYAITPQEEHIDFHQDVQKVYDHIRGLIPFPIGYGLVQGKKIKFHRAHILHQKPYEEAGKIVGLLDHGFGIACENGYVIIDEIQLEGKSKMDAKSFYNGAGKALVNCQLD